MASPNPGLFKTLVSGGAIGAYRIVSHGAADDAVVQASASTDALLGVTQQLGADGANERIDVCLGGIPEVVYGGAVTRGQPLTADADGKAVAAAPGAGVTARIVGFAMVSGVAGDIVPFQFAPGQITG